MGAQPSGLTAVSSISPRSIVIGLLLSVAVSFWGQYAADTLGYDPAFAHLPACLLLPFFLLVLGPNLLAKAFWRVWALSRAELIVVFAMGWAASMVPDRAIIRYLIAVVATPHYFATPENQWRRQFFDYLPDWLVVNDRRGAVTGFFEGIGPTESVPWLDWVSPLFWWATLFTALMWVGTCLIVMLRKQWVEYDRLRFPLGEVATRLLGEPDPNDPNETPFFQTRLFRVGFVCCALIMVWNTLSYWNQWPHFPIMGRDFVDIRIGRSFPPIPIQLNLFILCVAFFANTEILFSVWVFILFGILQQGILARIGLVSSASTIVPGGLVAIQSIGGLILFVLIGLWMSRRHLREVWHKAIGRPSPLRDEDELLSYRTAVMGFFAGLLYLAFWLSKAGLSFWVIVFLLFFLYLFYLALARIIAEAGLVMLDLPVNANQFTVGIIGSSNLSTPDVTVLGLANAFARNWRTFTMIGTSNIAWLRDQMSPKPGHLFRWLAIAFAVSGVTALVYTIEAGYARGAQNLRTDLTPLGVFFYNLIVTWINNATQVTALELSFLASGGALMILLSVCRYLFYWWPLHPIGLVVVSSSTTVLAVFPIFLAWLIQTILIRVGGGRLYRSVQPLFIGILVAYILGQGLSFLVDLLWFPGTPHLFESFWR